MEKGIASGKINRNEFKRENNDTVDNVEPILQNSMLRRSQENMVKLLSLLTEISKSKDKKTDKQPDTIDMPKLESEEFAEQNRKQKGVGLKILTPSQILRRLPISLAQIKAGNSSENLINEIKQLLYSLHRS